MALFFLAVQPLSACAGFGAGAAQGGAVASATAPGSASDVESDAAHPRPGAPVPSPGVFEARGSALWDGGHTLGGVWIAHPEARTARRVRVWNEASGAAADAALFGRDAPLTGPMVLVSSEAAEALGMRPGETADLRIVALVPPGAPGIAGEPVDPVAAGARPDGLAGAATEIAQ